MRFAQDRRSEGLRRLDADQHRAVERPPDDPIFDLLHRVCDGKSRDRTVCTSFYGFDDAVEECR